MAQAGSSMLAKHGGDTGVSAIIDEIYRTRVVRDATGHEYRLSSEVDSAEGEYLHHLISSDGSITKTLEVGCAFGLSSLHICEALRDRPRASHTIIDPKQMDVWHGVGVAHLERAGIDFFDLISEPSELALPNLLRRQPGSFDFAFIDGWHTFDQTMLDIFYANRLVRVGGYIVIDDCNWAGVSAAVSYYMNYPAFEWLRKPALGTRTWRPRLARAGRAALPPAAARMILPVSAYDRVYRRMCYPSMVAIKKVAEDTRGWAWFKGF
jgi:predicted O-methyltransferase YrrM